MECTCAQDERRDEQAALLAARGLVHVEGDVITGPAQRARQDSIAAVTQVRFDQNSETVDQQIRKTENI